MAEVRHFLRDDNLAIQEQSVVLAAALAFSKDSQLAREALRGMSIGLLFEKQSLRTRVSSEVACVNLGAHPLQLRGEELHFNRGETPEDAVKVLAGYLQLLMGRVKQHCLLEKLSEFDELPVVNGLSDLFHPLQALADLVTMKQTWGENISSRVVCYVGDGNNVCNSLLIAGAMQGLNMRAATPASLEPNKLVVETAAKIAQKTGGSVSVLNDPRAGVEGADAVYTDVWVSMGEENGADAHRKTLAGFQVDEQLFALTAKEGVLLHCLPAHRGEEVSSGVIDGPSSKVVAQAHNRLPATMALFLYLLAPEVCQEVAKS